MAKMHENNFSSHEYFNLRMKSNEILDAQCNTQPFSSIKNNLRYKKHFPK